MAYWQERLTLGEVTCIRAKVLGDSTIVVGGQHLLSVLGWHLHGSLGNLEHEVGSHFSLFQFRIVSLTEDTVLFEPTQDFVALRHSGEIHVDKAVELCCGLGGLSFGVASAGFQILAGVDISEWALQTFRLNHRATPLLGSIADPLLVAKLFQLLGGHAVGFLLGFPCPPFSSFGDRRGFLDSRAWTFIAGLDVIYLLNGAFGILECTPHVESFADFTSHLDSFARSMNFQWKSHVLHLDDAWPVRRSRWWAVVGPVDLLQHVELASLPHAPQLKNLKALIPAWPLWSPEEEALLKLSDEELDFHEQFAVVADLVLNLAGKCPTLLHSLAHLDKACPCGCRSAGLSPCRLKRDGISTVLLQCHHFQGLRFPHPSEAAYFCTIPPSFRFEKLRESLPLVGQTAAPLQAHWVAIALKRAFCCLHGSLHDSVNVLQEHKAFQAHLQSLALHLWPTEHTAAPRTVKLRFEGGCTLAVQVDTNSTIDDLIRTQKALGGWGARVQVTFQGLQLPFGAILKAATYDVRCYEPKQLMPAPTGEFAYALYFRDRVWVGVLKPGTLLGVLLALLGFSYHPGLRMLANGHAWTWGDFLWHPFVGELDLPVVGAGSDLGGLNHLQIQHEAECLVRMQRPSGFHLLPAGDLSRLLDLPSDLARVRLSAMLPPDVSKVFGIFCHHRHWSAIYFDRITSCAYHFDGSVTDSVHPARFLLDSLADHFHDRLVVFRSCSLVSQTDGNHCGAIALAHLGFVLGLWTSFSEQRAIAWSRQLAEDLIVGGGATEYSKAHSFLVNELPKHGVPASVAPARAALALKKLSPAAVIKASESKAPWQALKALASSQERPFQWVQHEELERHVEVRAANKMAPMHKQKSKRPVATSARKVALTPDQVQVAPNAFCDPDGKPLVAVSLDAISSETRGVAVASPEQALRYLVDNKSLSVDCLALLTVSAVAVPPNCKLDTMDLTWPGLHVDTQEPLLIRGTCIQLGDLVASPMHGKLVAPSVETDLVRLVIYRDQWPSDWKSLANGPLKQLILHFLPLQFCALGCASGCGKFHASVEEEGINMVVVDAFSWRWMDGSGKTIAAAKASSFSIMVRIPRSGTEAVLCLSGTDGLYAELRDPEQHATHPKFAVIWTKDTYDDARHKVRSTPHALHLVRFQSKYGVRCLKTFESEVYKTLFPDRHFVACAATLQFEMGPWPYGVTRQAIAEFLAGMEWVAKPLRPVKGGMQGRYWLIGSEVSPPSSVVAHTEAFLTITKVKEIQHTREPPAVVASMKTLNRLQLGSTEKDPWTGPEQDPWQNWKQPATAAAPVASAAASSKLEEMEQRLAEKFSEQIHEQVRSMHVDEDVEMSGAQIGRLDKLETGFTELKAQQVKFQSWCQEAADKMTLMSQRMTAQDENISSLGTQVAANHQATEKIGASLGAIQTQISQEMAAAMDRQTSHLEAILEKRARH